MTAAERLNRYAKPHPLRPGCWFFSTPQQAHTAEQALTIITYCELLKVPVTDVVTGRMMLRLVDRLEYLEERVQRLEKK